MTYSSACQRVTMLMRLPTLALPATAPIAGIGEPAGELAIGRRLELGVGVERHDDFRAAECQPQIQRTRLAAIAQRHQPNIAAGERLRDDVAGAVGRSVVDHDHLERIVLRGQNAADRRRDDLRLVVRRDQHGDQRLVRVTGSRDCLLSAPAGGR